MSRAQARLRGRTTRGRVVCVAWCRETGAASLVASGVAVVGWGDAPTWVWDVGVFWCGWGSLVRRDVLVTLVFPLPLLQAGCRIL